jgi:hypothetical protein
VGFRDGLDTEARRKILYLCQELNPGHPFWSYPKKSKLESAMLKEPEHEVDPLNFI